MTSSNGGDRWTLPVRALRRIGRGVLHLVDRTLHTARRRAARQHLRSLPKPASVLFICHGNICRSPYAEALLRRPGVLRDRNISVASAGFIGPDRPSPEEALAVARRRGLELGGHRSRLMTTGGLRRPVLPVVMSADQQRAVAAMAGRPRREVLVLGDLDPRPIRRRTIRDPWGQPEAVFDVVYARIERCVDELARVLNESEASDASDRR